MITNFSVYFFILFIIFLFLFLFNDLVKFEQFYFFRIFYSSAKLFRAFQFKLSSLSSLAFQASQPFKPCLSSFAAASLSCHLSFLSLSIILSLKILSKCKNTSTHIFMLLLKTGQVILTFPGFALYCNYCVLNVAVRDLSYSVSS